MPTVSFLKKRAAFEVPLGANLMESLLSSGHPVASSCHGDGVCAKCKITIVSGEGNLSKENPTEEFLKEKHKLPGNVRISCQAEIKGDIVVDATYW